MTGQPAVPFWRAALALSLLLLQVGHIRDVWSNYDPALPTRLHCVNRLLSTVTSDAGVRATARRLSCAFSSKVPITYVYVFYPQYGTEDRSWNVAIKYRGATPRLHWESGTHLHITVDGSVGLIEQLAVIHGIQIDSVFTSADPASPADPAHR